MNAGPAFRAVAFGVSLLGCWAYPAARSFAEDAPAQGALISEVTVTAGEKTGTAEAKTSPVLQMLTGEAYFKEYSVFFNMGAGDLELVFTPNAPLLVTLGAAMFDNELVLSLPIESVGEKGNGVGHSDYFGIQSTQHIGSFDLRGYLERYKGFYIDSDVIVKPDGNHFFFPDMALERYGGEIAYYSAPHTIRELDALASKLSGTTVGQFGLKIGLVYDKTTMSGVPQNGPFPASAQIPFSRAVSSTLCPRVGLLMNLVGDLRQNPRMTTNAYFLSTMLFSAGAGKSTFNSTDNGVVKDERLRLNMFELVWDVGIKPHGSNALVGGKLIFDGIVIDQKKMEYTSGMFGIYGKILY